MGKPTLHYGFTGTGRGMSDSQMNAMMNQIDDILDKAKAEGKKVVFHHGDCVGGDEQFHDYVESQKEYFDIYIIIHPPSDPKKRAFCVDANEVRQPKPYLERNHDIVDESVDGMFVAPFQNEEILRSGTWATYRYARPYRKIFFLER